MKDALQSQIHKRYVFHFIFRDYRVCTIFFVFVSCFDLEVSCLYRYTQNTKHEVYIYRVPNSRMNYCQYKYRWFVKVAWGRSHRCTVIQNWEGILRLKTCGAPIVKIKNFASKNRGRAPGPEDRTSMAAGIMIWTILFEKE